MSVSGPYGLGMGGERSQVVSPPDGLRPAQLGIVFAGRVILGHVGATVADLARRGFLGLEEVSGSGRPEWLLTDLRGDVAGHAGLLRFELTLCEGLFAGKAVVGLSGRGQELVPALSAVRSQISRDAIRNGWLSRWRRQHRTSRGEQLLTRIQVFRRELRALAAEGNAEDLERLAPYAAIFGLSAPPGIGSDGHEIPAASRRDPEVRWSNDRFFTSWLGAFAGCTTIGRSGSQHQPSDFAREWSLPSHHGHGHGASSDHSAAHGSDYGHYGSTDHGGHIAGGGHAGR
jgi:hypothetical protein